MSSEYTNIKEQMFIYRQRIISLSLFEHVVDAFTLWFSIMSARFTYGYGYALIVVILIHLAKSAFYL